MDDDLLWYLAGALAATFVRWFVNWLEWAWTHYRVVRTDDDRKGA